MTVFGVAPPGGEMARHGQLFGPLGYPRFFFAPGKRFGWQAWPLSLRLPGTVPVVSVKTWNEQDFAAMLIAPQARNEWWFCFAHEPEDEIVAGTLTVEAMRQVYARAQDMIDATPNTGCKLVLVLNWWQLTRGRFVAAQFDAVAEHVDMIGVDSYAPRDLLAKNVYVTPGELLGPALDLAERHGLPWSVPEFGVAMAADGNKQRHAGRLRAYARWASAHEAAWVSWWCNPAGDYAPHICTTAAYDMAFATWRDLMTG